MNYDITFCGFYSACKNGKTCKRALNDKVKLDILNMKIIISQFMELPDCFKKSK